MSYMITKASGIQQAFDPEKVRRSLKRAGATGDLAQEIINQIISLKPRTTHEIYRIAIEKLKKANKPIAARYNVKQALLELGPSGFPFEQLVSEIFKHLGYRVYTDQHIMGACVEHEVDVVARKNSQTDIIECKFHNQQALLCDVKVPLYVKARFDDIKQAAQEHVMIPSINNVWIVTNTRFSSQAIEYGQCVGMRLIDWSYPKHNSLIDLIERFKLHPITALTTLTPAQKQELISHGLILCNNARNSRQALTAIGMKESEVMEFIDEAELVCAAANNYEGTSK